MSVNISPCIQGEGQGRGRGGGGAEEGQGRGRGRGRGKAGEGEGKVRGRGRGKGRGRGRGEWGIARGRVREKAGQAELCPSYLKVLNCCLLYLFLLSSRIVITAHDLVHVEECLTLNKGRRGGGRGRGTGRGRESDMHSQYTSGTVGCSCAPPTLSVTPPTLCDPTHSLCDPTFLFGSLQ